MFHTYSLMTLVCWIPVVVLIFSEYIALNVRQMHFFSRSTLKDFETDLVSFTESNPFTFTKFRAK